MDISRLPLIDQYKYEMAEIEIWLSDNDYIINKHTLSEYSDTDKKWLDYLAKRKNKLARINELQTLIGMLDQNV